MGGSINCFFNGWPDWRQPVDISKNTEAITIWQGTDGRFLRMYDSFYALLSPQEKAAALNYYQIRHQQRYIIQHGILRLLLGHYLDKAPTEITFKYNHSGKPYLADGNCFFNLSRSNGEFLISISDIEVGVDIEKINMEFAYHDIISNYFSAAESAYINQSANPTEAFFLLWTRKEALLKACGTGIDDNLPNMPALNGKHMLPAIYHDIEWVTESFYANNGCMASLTYPAPQKLLAFKHITEDIISNLSKKQY